MSELGKSQNSDKNRDITVDETASIVEEQAVPAPPPPPQPEFSDWDADLAMLGGMGDDELCFSNLQIGDISLNPFVGDGISHLPNETETSHVQFESTVQSFNRSVDAYHGAPMYVVKGPILNTRENRGFTRNVEMVGDMIPNILIGGSEGDKVYKISRMTTLNLKDTEHSVVPSGTSYTPPQFLRFNLFNGQTLFVRETISQSVTQPIVKFLNIDSDFRVAVGIKAGFDQKDILPCLQPLRKAIPEYNLVSAALKTAIGSRREPDIEFYRFPHEWFTNPDVPENVKVFLHELHGTAPGLPEFGTIDQPSAIDALVQQFEKDAATYPEELLEGLEIVKEAMAEYSDEQKATLYQELMKSPVTRRLKDNTHVDVYEDLFLELLSPDTLNSGLSDLARKDPSFKLDKFARFLSFDFEGRTYSVEFEHVGTYSRLKAPNLVISLKGASARLQDVLEAASHHIRLGEISLVFASFEIALPSYVKSVVTRKARENHGFGRAQQVWNERVLINLRYRGVWLVASTENTQISAWTRRINNQLVAETIHATLKSDGLTVVSIREAAAAKSLLELDEKYGNYLDGPDIRGTTILRPVANVDWSKPVNYPALYSGLGRILPTRLINLALTNSRVSILNLEEYLLGRDDLQFGLKDRGYPTEYRFRWEETLNLKCAELPRALDWWSEMRKVSHSRIDDPAQETEVAVPASTSQKSEKPPKQPKKSSGPNQKSGKEASKGKQAERISSPLAKPEPSKSKGKGNSDIPKTPHQPVTLAPVATVTPSLVEFDEGHWACQYAQTCSIDERRYAASRCLDHLQKRKDWSAHINTKWVDTLLSYVALPAFDRPEGSSKNWYISEIPNMPLPSFLTYVASGNSWITLPAPPFEQGVETRALPHWQRLPSGDIPHWMKKGRDNRASIFTEIQR